MSRFITPPDKDFRQVPNILIKNFKPSEVELVALTAKVSPAEFDIYLYNDDFADANWADDVEGTVDRTFDSNTSKINEVIEYLQSLNG